MNEILGNEKHLISVDYFLFWILDGHKPKDQIIYDFQPDMISLSDDRSDISAKTASHYETLEFKTNIIKKQL